MRSRTLPIRRGVPTRALALILTLATTGLSLPARAQGGWAELARLGPVVYSVRLDSLEFGRAPDGTPYATSVIRTQDFTEQTSQVDKMGVTKPACDNGYGVLLVFDMGTNLPRDSSNFAFGAGDVGSHIARAICRAADVASGNEPAGDIPTNPMPDPDAGSPPRRPRATVSDPEVDDRSV